MRKAVCRVNTGAVVPEAIPLFVGEGYPLGILVGQKAEHPGGSQPGPHWPPAFPQWLLHQHLTQHLTLLIPR